jgi:hypothetical protein
MIHYVELSALPKEADVELQVIAVTKSSLAIENINTRTFGKTLFTCHYSSLSGITTAPLSISLTSLTCVDTLRIVHCYVHHHGNHSHRLYVNNLSISSHLQTTSTECYRR